MKIILDTNAIVSNFRMDSPNFQVLLENSKNGKDQIYIPQIVLDEVINKYGQRINAIKSTTEREINIYNQLTKGTKKRIISKSDIDTDIKKYSEYVEQLINESKIIKLPYPKTPHEIIAKRAMHKKKPFNSNGAGYRDNLIWENIKELLTQDQEVLILPELIFITNNYKDFATKEFELHPDLINELENEYYNSESIQIFSKLGEYIDKEAKVHLEQEKKIESKLKNNELDDLNLNYITSRYLFDNFINYELNSDEIELRWEFENPSISSISEDYEINDISVKKLSDTKILVDLSFDLEVYLDVFIYKMDYWGMDDEEKPSISDSDWNDHYMLGQIESVLNLSMSLIIDNQMEVLSCQVNRINKDYM